VLSATDAGVSSRLITSRAQNREIAARAHTSPGL
jgi:hypothetical protein